VYQLFIYGVVQMNINPPSTFISEIAVNPSSILTDPTLAIKLMDESIYSIVRSYITKSENENGDYDYSGVPNIGIVYLFIHRKDVKRKANTKLDYSRELIQFLRKISEMGIVDIRLMKRVQMESYQEWMELKYPKTKTQAKKVTILKAFLAWCYFERYLKKDLTRGLVGVKLDKKQIPDREIDKSSLQKAILYYEHDPKFRSLMMLLATTGLRLNEVIIPKWKDLYFDSVRKKYYVRTETKRDGACAY
jgi:integrase/recombinase XerD